MNLYNKILEIFFDKTDEPDSENDTTETQQPLYLQQSQMNHSILSQPTEQLERITFRKLRDPTSENNEVNQLNTINNINQLNQINQFNSINNINQLNQINQFNSNNQLNTTFLIDKRKTVEKVYEEQKPRKESSTEQLLTRMKDIYRVLSKERREDILDLINPSHNCFDQSVDKRMNVVNEEIINMRLRMNAMREYLLSKKE